MQKMAFITRHAPTPEQHALAAVHGYELVAVGDCDAFDEKAIAGTCHANADATAFAVVHPGLALTIRAMRPSCVIGVFENACRPVEGGKPVFVAKALHLYR